MSKEYWNKKHSEDYSKTDWAYKPSIFATQAIKYFPSTGKILEIGTGQGGDAEYLHSLGYEVIATDYSDAAIESAAKRVSGVEFMNVDTSQGLPFAGSSFDVVYSHMAIHYFDAETTRKVFEDIYRILKPGGIIAVITNTVDDTDKNESIELEPGYYQDPKGIKKRYFSIESMDKFTRGLFETVLLDANGETYKDDINTLIRFIGKKI